MVAHGPPTCLVPHVSVAVVARGAYLFDCPNCAAPIEVEVKDLQCGIFRHAWYIHNGVQIPPHATKEFCDMLIERKLIYGCGKPFEMQRAGHNTLCAVACGYI